jgi:signal transduction histidine kinase
VRIRRTKPLVLAFAASILLAVAAMLTLDLWWRHERAIAAAESRAANLTIALSEYVRSTFALADASLRQLVIHGNRLGGPGAPSADWLPILEATDLALPGSGSVSVTDARGLIVHSTLKDIVGQPRRSSYLFQYLAVTDTDEMVIDEPFATPLHKGQYVLPVGRRLEGPGGRFAGVVVSVLLPDAFERVFKTVDVGPNGVIDVFHRTGIVMFREPSPANAIGQEAGDHPLVRRALAEPGLGHARGHIEENGPRYISAFRSQPDAPFIVAVSLSEQDALADWRAQVQSSLLGFSLFTATLGGIVFLLFRQVDARLEAEQALANTQRHEAERLREANERLEAVLHREQQARTDAETASRLKDEFLMTLSHELRTPLNAILGWSRMLAGGALTGEQQARAIETIERNARTQTRLVEDLLDVSRAITGKLHLQIDDVDVGAVVRAAAETLRPAIAARGLAFDVSLAPRLPRMLADRERLQQVVWNLLSNAIKFTPTGGSITLAVERAEDGIEIRIEDTGKGIAPEFLPHIFERFRQADAGTRREATGLGLGLSIARYLVELHGGTLTGESAGEGQGTTFRIYLPGAGPGPVSA